MRSPVSPYFKGRRTRAGEDDGRAHNARPREETRKIPHDCMTLAMAMELATARVNSGARSAGLGQNGRRQRDTRSSCGVQAISLLPRSAAPASTSSLRALASQPDSAPGLNVLAASLASPCCCRLCARAYFIMRMNKRAGAAWSSFFSSWLGCGFTERELAVLRGLSVFGREILGESVFYHLKIKNMNTCSCILDILILPDDIYSSLYHYF